MMKMSHVAIPPCLFFLVVFFLVGTYCQQETSQARYRFSQLIPTNSVYEHRESDVPLEWGKKNDTSLLLRSLEENNVMDMSRLNSKENTEEIEEEGEEEVEEDDGVADECDYEINAKSGIPSDYIKEQSKCKRPIHEHNPLSNVDGLHNARNREYDEDHSTNQYDSYYYYEDYDNNNRSQYKTVDAETVDYADFETHDATTERSAELNNHEDHPFIDEGVLKEDNEEDDSISTTNTDAKEVTSMEGSNKNFAFMNPPKLSPSSDDPDELESSILIGEAIVSVVTTKSVVNGTISIPTSTPTPMTTEQVAPPPSLTKEKSIDDRILESTTTEDSRVLAFVQTSRSINGARFLPFPVVDRVVRINNDAAAMTSIKKTFPPPESTESIIDKLDRVQSELSSGFLVGGFRTAGNTLQLDVLNDRDRTTRRKYVTSTSGSSTTTSKTPIISKFVPRRYNDKRFDRTNVNNSSEGFLHDSDSSVMTTNTPRAKIAFKWPSGKTTTPLNSDETKSTTQASTAATKKTNTQIIFQDVKSFLPPGFKLSKEDRQEITERSALSDILAKSKVDVSKLLPADYNKKKNGEIIPASVDSSNFTTEKISIQNLFANSKFDVTALLPRDYTEKATNSSESKNDESSDPNNNNNNSTLTSTEPTTAKASGLKIVFPSRPGGRKLGHKITTPQSHRIDGLPAITPRIQKGWPTRATTEFTGWPTPSTTPISIEKLLEVARTATDISVNMSVVETTSAVSITSTTTTTTTTPRSTTIGICEEECEVAGTIRIIGNTIWVPELLDRNTQEWQQLANEIERDMNFVFSKSTVLMNWYKKIRIDSFSQGSILVDFFIELVNLPQRINTQELKVIFHDSLRTYNSSRWNETKGKGDMKLGVFTIDPKSTDFVVIPKVPSSNIIENEDRLIPQWAVVMIVIGIGGLLFIIVFGVSVLVNRQNGSKLKPSVSTIYEDGIGKNILGNSHATSLNRSNDYPKQIHTIWTDPDVSWNDKSFESTSNKVLVDRSFQEGKKYNLHDSWRSEWNGYYSNPSHGNNKYSGYHHHHHQHPDYDTNF
ncbi:uncharacterized protein LOC122633647 [Vespula pensylvanica]|nr:uncharacterized protein LOC122633647 [Vespula pensylvanica]